MNASSSIVTIPSVCVYTTLAHTSQISPFRPQTQNSPWWNQVNQERSRHQLNGDTSLFPHTLFHLTLRRMVCSLNALSPVHAWCILYSLHSSFLPPPCSNPIENYYLIRLSQLNLYPYPQRSSSTIRKRVLCFFFFKAAAQSSSSARAPSQTTPSS